MGRPLRGKDGRGEYCKLSSQDRIYEQHVDSGGIGAFFVEDADAVAYYSVIAEHRICTPVDEPKNNYLLGPSLSRQMQWAVAVMVCLIGVTIRIKE